MNEDVVEWEALEFEPHTKGPDWFWILGIVVVIGALISIILGNTLFAVLVVLGGFIIGIYATKHPDELHCVANRRGVFVNHEGYPFSSIDTFWIDETRSDRPKLLLTLKNRFALHVSIPLGNADIDDLHEYLSGYIHEEEQNESLVDHVMEWLKI